MPARDLVLDLSRLIDKSIRLYRLASELMGAWDRGQGLPDVEMVLKAGDAFEDLVLSLYRALLLLERLKPTGKPRPLTRAPCLVEANVDG